MSLSHEHVGPKILGKIKMYVLTRAELLFPLCYEIPCTPTIFRQQYITVSYPVRKFKRNNVLFLFRLNLQEVYPVVKNLILRYPPVISLNWQEKVTKGLCQILLFYSKKIYIKLLNLMN